MERIVRRYKTFLMLGFFLVLLSFAVGIYRTSNQAGLSQLEFDGDTSSSNYRAALTTEAVLMRYSEIVPLLGLGFLKLGIGFAIATIVTNIRATGKNAQKSLRKANFNIEEPQPPFFSRNFPRFLVLGIVFELIATVVMIGWIFTGLSLIDLQFAGLSDSISFQNMTILNLMFEVFAEPLEGLGVAFLIGGISFGLATIVANLGMQVTMLPKYLTSLVTGRKDSNDLGPISVIHKKLVRLTILGMVITASGLLPIAIIRAYNVVSLENMIFAGDTASKVYQSALVTERMIGFTWETWMFIGIAVLLFAIGFWLLKIIRLLRAQRSNLSQAVSDITGLKVSSLEPELWTTRFAPLLLIAGLVWMLVFFGVFNVMRDFAGLAVLGEQFAGRVGSDIFQQNTISQSTLGILVRPGKAISLALLFSGIGFALVTIVVNLRLTSMMLPGSFTKIFNAIKGESVPQDVETSSTLSPMSFAPKKLFYGILVGVVIVVLGTFPLALMRIFNTEIYLAEMLAGQTSSSAFQAAKQTQLMLEHFIGVWVAVGVGTIFFSIGKFFSTIVGFVQARRQMISEGVESAVYLILKKKP